MSIKESTPEPPSGDPIVETDDGQKKPQKNHLELGARFSEIVRTVTDAYIETFTDSDRARRMARRDALLHIATMHGISQSTVRLYLYSYARFHAMPRAVEFLRKTDMRLLLGADISEEIVEAVIELRAADPSISTLGVKQFIHSMRKVDCNPEAPAP